MFVRVSSYRHVYGVQQPRDQWFDNLRIGNTTEGEGVSVGAKYLTVSTAVGGGGAFQVLPIATRGRYADLPPLCRGHTGPVLDTAFSPFSDRTIASGGDDGSIFIWNIDDSVFSEFEDRQSHSDPIRDHEHAAKLNAAARKVTQVLFSPVAENVLVSSHADHAVRVWDVNSSDAPVNVLSGIHEDAVQSASIKSDGILMATTCRDRKLRILDIRSGAAVASCEGHAGVKASRVTWASDALMVSTGFSKMSERQMSLWDSRNLSVPAQTVALDHSAGVIMPYYSDNGLVFLSGKGDGNIRYYELESGKLHYLSSLTSNLPQRGMAFMPRRALDTSTNEIARAFKVHQNAVEPISFVVPRKEQAFQADLYPPAPADVPACSAKEFFAGKAFTPKFMDMKDGSITGGSVSSSLVAATKQTASPAATKTSSAAAAVPSQSPSLSPAPTSSPASATPTAAAAVKSSSLAPASTESSPAPSPRTAVPVSAMPLPVTSEPKSSVERFSTTSPAKASSPAELASASEMQELRKTNSSLETDLQNSRAKVHELEQTVEDLKSRMRRAIQSLAI